MCGISGIVGPGCRNDLIDRMVRAQAHRGPDASGTYMSPDKTCGLGHNRLSIIDLSSAAVQPMKDTSGQLHIVFNGEIYNYIELKQEIGPYPYKTQSDTEVILAAFRKWGPACVSHFIGMFAFAIWDEKNRALFCARDRLGIKPFHYTVKNGVFYFASEIKALLAAGIEADADEDVWATYLHYGIYDHSDRTFFADIGCLPPGHVMTFRDGAMKTTSYWDLGAVAAAPLSISLDQAAEEFRALMSDSVRLRMRSDVPLGVNLSGGLDSSALLSFVDAQPESNSDLHYFTYGFSDPAYDEENFSDNVPKEKNWHKNIARLDPDTMWNDIDGLMLHQEAPYGGTGTLAYYHLHRAIRQRGVTVILEGQGVDEMLGGYAYYQKPDTAGLYQDGTSFLRPECLSADMRTNPPPRPVFETPFSSLLSNRLYQDIRHTKLPRVLRMNDRLSMAFGRELREPYLDHRVVEFCFRLPDDYKIREGHTKYLLRHAMRDRLPGSVRDTKKRAIVTPQREWIKGPLRTRIQDIIHSRSFRELGIFDATQAAKSFNNFCRGEGDNAFFIWQWLNADSWFRTFRKAASDLGKEVASC